MVPAAVLGPRGRLLPLDYSAALALCATCPVIEPCRAAGATEPEGVWGGTTPETRGTLSGVRRRGRERTARELAGAGELVST